MPGPIAKFDVTVHFRTTRKITKALDDLKRHFDVPKRSDVIRILLEQAQSKLKVKK